MLESLTLFVRTVTYSFIGLSFFVRYSAKLPPTSVRLCEVAGNRRRKFRFRRHVAKANFYLLNYEKKPIELAFCGLRSRNFQLSRNPAILQNPCYAQCFCHSNVSQSLYSNHCSLFTFTFLIILLGGLLHLLVFGS
jgi:hypothetical protein